MNDPKHIHLPRFFASLPVVPAVVTSSAISAALIEADTSVTPPRNSRGIAMVGASTGAADPRMKRKTSSSSSVDTMPSISPSLAYRTLARDSPAGVGHGTIPLPRNLAVAVLDDNSLVRKSMGIILRLHVIANMDRSVVLGATLDEALSFPQTIIDKKVDIAIFDENLEFADTGTLKGSILAARALKLGFKGCLILHSANTALAENLDPCFHGFVEKTSSKEYFLRCLAVAFQRYQQH